MLKKQQAFTMIELLVVSTIVILLTAAGLVSFGQAMMNSRNAKRKADLETMRQALTLYKQDYGYYDDKNNIDFTDLVNNLYTAEYLSEASLVDPKDDATYFYQAICSATSGSNCTRVTLRATLEATPPEVYDVVAF